MARETEGNTYVANWEKVGKGYRAWLKRRPKARVEGGTEDELKEQLWEIALDAYGDGEACIELVPPLPAARGSASYFEPAWYRLSNNEGLHYQGNRAALYRDGQCKHCKSGLGGRNETIRVLPPLRSDLGFVWWEHPDVKLVSEDFLRFFRPLLGKSLRAIPCTPEKPTRKKFFELILPADLKMACPKDADERRGRVCPKCGTTIEGYFLCARIKKGMIHGVVREQLLARKGHVHAAQSGLETEILVDESIAARLRRSKLKGVLLDRLALIPQSEAGEYKFEKIRKGDY